MNFDDWFNGVQTRHSASYSSYEDLLKECWSAATERAAKIVDAMADECEKEYEPTALISWVRRNADDIRGIK